MIYFRQKLAEASVYFYMYLWPAIVAHGEYIDARIMQYGGTRFSHAGSEIYTQQQYIQQCRDALCAYIISIDRGRAFFNFPSIGG